jgi:hypothetical protein
MATDETLIVHPGDILQDTSGQFFLAASTHSWGVGAVQRWTDGGEVRETYHRLKPGQFVVVGSAHTLPEEVAQARRDSIATARALAREGDGVEQALEKVRHPVMEHGGSICVVGVTVDEVKR